MWLFWLLFMHPRSCSSRYAVYLAKSRVSTHSLELTAHLPPVFARTYTQDLAHLQHTALLREELHHPATVLPYWNHGAY